MATIEIEATELITVFPESVDSPRRSFGELILRALRTLFSTLQKMF